MVAHLPQELIDAIIEHLSDDERALVALLSTARCFSRLPREYLYRRTTIGTSISPVMSDRDALFRRTCLLRDVILGPSGHTGMYKRGNPSFEVQKVVAASVRHLTCELNEILYATEILYHEEPKIRDDSDLTVTRDAEWDVLATIIPTLVNLESLRLEFASWDGHRQTIGPAHSRVAHLTHLKTLASPSVETLTVHCYDTQIELGVMSALLKCYPALRCLRLDCVQLSCGVGVGVGVAESSLDQDGGFGHVHPGPVELAVRQPSPAIFDGAFRLDMLESLVVHEGIMADITHIDGASGSGSGSSTLPALQRFCSLVRMERDSPFIPNLLNTPQVILCFDAQWDIRWFEAALTSPHPYPYRLRNLGILIPLGWITRRHPMKPVYKITEADWSAVACVLDSPCFAELQTVCVTFLLNDSVMDGCLGVVERILGRGRSVRVRTVESWDVLTDFDYGDGQLGAMWREFL